jgi:hypothetical protein
MKYILTIIAIFFTFYTAKNFISYILFFNNANTTIGTITQLIIDKRTEHQNEKYYYATLSFVTTSGEKINVSTPFSMRQLDVHIGDQKKIFYAKNNPTNVLIERYYSSYGKWIFWSIVCIALITLTVFFWKA